MIPNYAVTFHEMCITYATRIVTRACKQWNCSDRIQMIATVGTALRCVSRSCKQITHGTALAQALKNCRRAALLKALSTATVPVWKITVLWDMAQCSLVVSYQRFRGNSASIFRAEESSTLKMDSTVP
jgi:hypothetical protein